MNKEKEITMNNRISNASKRNKIFISFLIVIVLLPLICVYSSAGDINKNGGGGIGIIDNGGVGVSTNIMKSNVQVVEGQEKVIGDDVVEYNPLWKEYKPVEISDKLNNKLFEGAIIEHTKICGVDCHSIIEVNLDQPGILVQDIKFFTVTETDKIEEPISDYQIYIKTGEQDGPAINDYDLVCHETGRTFSNGTKETTCIYQIVGNHVEQVPIWTPYNLNDEVDAGTYEIKIDGVKDFYKTIDWQIETQDMWIDNWADWGAGGTITHDGAYVIHTFLADGTFNVTSTKSGISILLVGGGGSGGGPQNSYGGGGGAGGIVYVTNYTLNAGSYMINVGMGGPASTDISNEGTDTTFNGTGAHFNAVGGGGGANPDSQAKNGGCGGGTNGYFPQSGNSIQPNFSSAISYGNIGGTNPTGYNSGAGGGGAGTKGGQVISENTGTVGGNGTSFTIYNGTPIYYGGGGGGGGGFGGFGIGGLGGGGQGGAPWGTDNAVAGTDGTGGGGGGSSGNPTITGKAGGSGILIIRYLNNNAPNITNVSWTTTGGISSTSLIYNQILSNITSTIFDADGNSLIVNVTLIAPDGTFILNNASMTNSSVSSNSTYYYLSNISLSQAGTWTIYVSAYDESDITTSSSTFNVFTLNVSTKDGYYGYSKNKILNLTDIESASVYRYDLYEMNDNMTNMQSRWSTVLTAINNTYNVNSKVGLNYVLDFNLTNLTLIDYAKRNITVTMNFLKLDPYYAPIAYISLQIINQSYNDSIISFALNNIAANITAITGNKFVIFSKNYNSTSLDNAYIKPTTMLYLNTTDEASWINLEASYAQSSTSLNRIYVNPTASMEGYIYNYQKNIIANLRAVFNTTIGLTNNTASTINGDLIIFNNQTSNIIRQISMPTVTQDIGKDLWDSTNKLFVANNTNMQNILINTSGYSATLVFADDLSNIFLTSIGTGTLYKIALGSTLAQNWSDGTRDGSWNLDAANDILIELFDPHYVRNNFMVYYGWLNVSFINLSYTHFPVLIIADKNAPEISKLNCSATQCYGYISVADFTNDETWQTNKQAEVDSWIATNASMNIFVDGLDSGIGGVNFSVRFKQLVDYVRVTKGKKAILNTYTAYQQFATWGDGVMKESCVERWNGASPANPDNYTRENWGLELNRSSFFSSHGIPVYCQAFANRTTNPYMIANYTDLMNIYYASKVLGYQSFYLTQPDFGYTWNIFLPDLGSDMSNDWSTNDNVTYFRRYSKGIVYYNSSSGYGHFDDGRTINNVKMCFNLYDANPGSVSFDFDVNLFPVGPPLMTPPAQGQYSIPDTNLTIGVFVSVCKDINASLDGRYVVDGFVNPRNTIIGQGLSIGWEQVPGLGIHSWFDNTAGGYNWNTYASGQNWEVTVVVNDTTKSAIDTFPAGSGIYQSNNGSVVGKYNLTLTSTYPVNLEVDSDLQTLYLNANVTNITFFNGTGYSRLNTISDPSCTTTNPVFGKTVINNELYGACYYNNSGIINWRVSAPHLSNNTFQLLTDEQLPSVIFNFQDPNAIDTFNLFGGLLNISYNISGTYLNASQVNIYFKTTNPVNLNICYQESTNVYNQTGIDGSCGLNYTGTYSFSGDHEFITYVKPFDSKYGSIWEVKYGSSSIIQNITIPIDCFNVNSSQINFSIFSSYNNGHWANTSAYCWNGTWKLIGSVFGDDTGVGSSPLCSSTSSNAFDGDWNTFSGFDIICSGWTLNGNPDGNSRVYEEAMIWNSTKSEDCLFYVNGIATQCGYQNNPLFVTNNSNVWQFRLSDNLVYPATYNYDEYTMEHTIHSSSQLNSSSQYLKIRLYNVSLKTYGIYEVMANATPGTVGSLGVIYCNESYSNGDPMNSTYCDNFFNLNPSTPYNHTHTNYSSHMTIPFAINLSTQSIGSVVVTPTSYFVLKGVDNGTWNYYYINTTANVTKLSLDNGTTYLNQSYTVDSHLHQYNGTEVFSYYVCANDTFGNMNCSNVRQDLLNLTGLPPTAPDVYSPSAGIYYNQIININYTAAQSPNNFPIVIYNISLVYPNQSFISSIVSNNSNNLSATFNVSNLSFGSYKVAVQACDNYTQCSYGFSDTFIIAFINTFIVYPPNNSFISNNSINFTWNVSAPLGLQNSTIYIYQTNQTMGYGLCFQETANISTACGGLNTGSYGSSQNWTNESYFYDGNYSTFGSTSGFGNYYLYINYTTPNLAIGAIWHFRLKDSVLGNNFYNYSIPCFNSSLIQLRQFYSSGAFNHGIFLDCYNGASWQTIYSTNFLDGNNPQPFYEEAIIWNMTNQTVFENNLINQTSVTFSPGNFFSLIGIPITLIDGVYNWFTDVFDITFDITGNYGVSNNQTLTIDTTAPSISITYPQSIVYKQGYVTNLTLVSNLNWTVSDNNLAYCWYNINNSANVSVNCLDNTTTFEVNFSNVPYVITLYANDSAGIISSSTVSPIFGYIMLESPINRFYNNFTWETQNQNYSINLSYDNVNYNITSVTFVYNGFTNSNFSTSYFPNGNSVTAHTNIDVPIISGIENQTQDFYWIFNLSLISTGLFSTSATTMTSNQTIGNIIFNSCDLINNSLNTTAANFTTFLNISFKDELSLQYINQSIQNMATKYFLGSGNSFEIMTYSNITPSPEYLFCFNVPQYNLNLGSLEIQYNNPTVTPVYFTRDVFYDSMKLVNTTTNLLLYNILQNQGSYTSFYMTDLNNVPLANVKIIMDTIISGNPFDLTEFTDSAGVGTFWVNPNAIYTVTMTRDGCTSKVLSLRPTQASYGFQLSCQGNATGNQSTNFPYTAPAAYIYDGVTFVHSPRTGALSPGNHTFEYQVVSNVHPMTRILMILYNNGSILKYVERNTSSNSTICSPYNCYVNTTYDFETKTLLGAYYADFGAGYLLLENDGQWLNIKTNTTGLTLKSSLLDFSSILSVTDTNGVSSEDAQRAEFSRIVWVFLIMAILFAFFNKYSGYDSANPGAFLLIMTGIIFLGSVAGGLTGNGFFYISNIIPEAGFPGVAYGLGSSQQYMAHFINNYLIFGYMALFLLGYWMSVSRRQT